MNTGYPHSCIIERATSQPNAYANRAETWAPVGDRLVCRLVIRSRRTADGPFAEAPVITTYTLQASRRADLRSGDRVRDVRDAAGEAIDVGPFRVDQLLPRRNARGAVVLQAAILERQGGPLAPAAEA